MRLSINKVLNLTPWELVDALRKAGLVDKDCCSVAVTTVEKNEANEGRTVIVMWSNQEQDVSLKEDQS